MNQTGNRMVRLESNNSLVQNQPRQNQSTKRKRERKKLTISFCRNK